MHWTAMLDVFLSPFGFGLLLAFVLWRWHRRLSRRVLRIGIGVQIICIFLSTPLGSNVLVSLQERRVPAVAECAAPQPNVIVLLSGGMRRDAVGAGDFGVLNAASLQRTLTAAELAKRTPDAQLVISGGAHNGNGAAQSSVMADIARGLGVPADAIRAETEATTTWENAMRVRALQPALPPRIWLVTSAIHMPRSLIAFRAAGFEPCAYAGDYRASSFDGAEDLLPSAGAITNADAVLHEWVGEIVYRLRAGF